MYIVKILFAIIIYSIIDFMLISSSYASPFASLHKLSVVISRVIPMEAALNCSNFYSIDSVTNSYGPTVIYFFHLAGIGNQ